MHPLPTDDGKVMQVKDFEILMRTLKAAWNGENSTGFEIKQPYLGCWPCGVKQFTNSFQASVSSSVKRIMTPTSKGLKEADSKSLGERFLCTAALRSSPGLYITVNMGHHCSRAQRREWETSLCMWQEKRFLKERQRHFQGVTGES